MKQIDVLAIGDIVIDAFIKLKDADVNCDIDKQNCRLSVRFGDKVPYESVEICAAVGNSANAAVSASRLGLNSALLTYVGGDQNGKDCIAELERNKVSTQYVRTASDKKTNYHYVLWYDVDRTILVKHEDYPYELGQIDKPKWIYSSSLGEHSFDMYEQISKYLSLNPDVKLAFQPGVFDMKMGKEKLDFIYKRANIACVNVEEAQRILDEKSRDVKNLLKKMSDLGPKTMIITDGFSGSYGYDLATDEYWFMKVPPHTPYERTGAGDAFFSTVVSCLSMGKTLPDALVWGSINSMSVVLQVGAQKGLLTSEKILESLAKMPDDFKPVKI